MSRTLGANVNLAASNNEALEPVLILEFDWPGAVYYTTKELDILEDIPKILKFSTLLQTVKSSNISSITTINVTLDDSSEAIKNFLNTTDLEQTNVNGYIYYDGLSGDALGTKIFVGRIVSPYTWDESTRTIQLTIESYISSDRVGFSIESGQYSINNEIAVNKVWPIVFGKPAHVPAVLAQKKPAAILKFPINMGGAIGNEELYKLTGTSAGFEITDWTLIQSYNVNNNDVIIDFGVLYVENSEEFEQDTPIDIIIDGVVFKGSFNGNIFTIDEANAPKYENLPFLDRENGPDLNNALVFWVDAQYLTLVDHYLYFHKINNTTMDMGGEEYIIRKVTKQEGNKIWIDRPIIHYQDRQNLRLDPTIGQIDKVRALPQNGLLIDITRYTNNVARLLKGRSNRSGQSNPFGQLIETLQLIKYVKGAFWNRDEGTEVRLWDANVPDIYVANSVESNALISVYGKRTINNVEKFVPIPSHYYTFNLSESTDIPFGEGPQTVTTLRFSIPLHAYVNQNWSDEIYVTVDSTLSKNGVSAIKHILDTYTDLNTDSTTFNNVAADLINYETHFAILEHYDAIKLCEKIAYQLRCGLLIDSSNVKIINLSKKNSSVFTFNDTNIEFKSIRQYTQAGKDRVTRHIGTYRPTYEPKIVNVDYNKKYDYEIIIENNINKYGLSEESIDFFIFRNKEQVVEALEFWNNRQSKVWKIVEFIGFHDSIIIEPMDIVTINLDTFYLGTAGTQAVIIKSENTFIEGRIKYTAILPVEAGESTEDDLFWNYFAITRPTNPADQLYIVDYDIQEEKEEISVDEFIKVLNQLTRRQKTLARNKIAQPLQNINDDIATMDILTDGSNNDPEYSNIDVDLTNNTLDLKDGELVFVQKDSNGKYFTPSRWGIHTAKVVSIDDDTVSVAFVNNSTEYQYDTFQISKPYTLKRSTYDNQTIDGITYTYVDEQTRLATDGTNTETQTITPKYYIDDIIDISYSTDYGGNWIDLNTDARSWAAGCSE